MNMLFNSRNVKWNGSEYEELLDEDDDEECELQLEECDLEEDEEEEN